MHDCDQQRAGKERRVSDAQAIDKDEASPGFEVLRGYIDKWHPRRAIFPSAEVLGGSHVR